MCCQQLRHHQPTGLYEVLPCHWVPDNTLQIDGEPTYAYISLQECYQKCDNTPQCVGFLVRTSGECVWKSDEATLEAKADCGSDYLRKPTSQQHPRNHPPTNRPTDQPTDRPTDQLPRPSLVPCIVPSLVLVRAHLCPIGGGRAGLCLRVTTNDAMPTSPPTHRSL